MPTLSPATLRLEYRLETPNLLLTIAWATRTAAGSLSRQLSEQDAAGIAALARALSTRGAGWEPLSSRVADLLLGGIAPLDGVRRLIVSVPEAASPLRAIPFEALGTPPLLERFAVWYELSGGDYMGPRLTSLWPVPPETTARFNRRFGDESAKGYEIAEALRRVKLEWLRSGGEQAHPFHWAGFVLSGDGAKVTPPVIPWLWGTGAGLLSASVAFLIWWRRKRFELL